MNCKICGSESPLLFKAVVLRKHEVGYFHCRECNYIFTEEPYWLEEAYTNPINHSDTGLLNRNIFYSKILSLLLFFFFKKNGKFLDFAGGYGVFSRLMRDNGFDFYWNDPFCTNLFSYGFELDKAGTTWFELLTSFESFEHFPNPLNEIEKMLSYSRNIFFSTELFSGEAPDKNGWWYYSFEQGQHVSFYSAQTLGKIAAKYGLHFYSFGDYHLFSEKKLNGKVLGVTKLLAKLGFHYPVRKLMKEKIWEDHLKITKMERND